jgi:hypothetical protein
MNQKIIKISNGVAYLLHNNANEGIFYYDSYDTTKDDLNKSSVYFYINGRLSGFVYVDSVEVV